MTLTEILNRIMGVRFETEEEINLRDIEDEYIFPILCESKCCANYGTRRKCYSQENKCEDYIKW